MLAKIAGLIESSGKSPFDIVKYCHMELAEPTVAQAFNECVLEGAKHVVVHPYFLVPGRHSTKDIPKLVREAASRHAGVSYYITEPLGIHENIIEVVIERSDNEESS